MDAVLQFLHQLMPFVYIAAAVVFILKGVVVFGAKGFDIPSFIISFFRLYTRREKKATTNQTRIRYMRYNNVLNWFFYIFLLLFIFMLITYQDRIFSA